MCCLTSHFLRAPFRALIARNDTTIKRKNLSLSTIWGMCCYIKAATSRASVYPFMQESTHSVVTASERKKADTDVERPFQNKQNKLGIRPCLVHSGRLVGVLDLELQQPRHKVVPCSGDPTVPTTLQVYDHPRKRQSFP